MASEYILLEKLERDRFYIRLSFEIPDKKPDAIDGIDIQSITLIESLRSGSPHLVIKLADMAGNLFKDRPILPGYRFILRLGRTKEDAIESHFKFSNMELVPSANNTVDSVTLSFNLVTDHWETLFKRKYSRSWSSRKISDIVGELASEIGFESIDIEPTFGIDSYIQPYWSNSDFLVWLSRRAVNNEGTAGYQYAHTYDNGFFFKTYDNMYSAKPKKKLIYSPQAVNKNGFMTFNVKNDYMGNVMYGASGVEYGYFDYNKKQYVTGHSDVTTVDERQLSDWYYLDESHLRPSVFMDGGRDIKTDNAAECKVLVQANTIHTAEMLCVGDPELHIGDIVDIVVPNLSRSDKQLSINEYYSGRWLIWKIHHSVVPKNGLYSSKLSISRSGLNGIDIDGLVQTTTGKVIK